MSSPRVCVVFHCGYTEEWKFYKTYIQTIPCEYDMYVSLVVRDPIAQVEKVESEILIFKPNAVITKVANRGLDGGGWFMALHSIFKANKSYDYLLKVHTKSPRNYSPMWRIQLLTPLLGSGAHVQRCFNLFASDSTIGMIGCNEWLRVCEPDSKHIQQFAEKHGLPFDPTAVYVGGTMFWARFEPMVAPFRALDLPAVFDKFSEGYHSGETEGHMMERIYGMLIKAANLRLYGMKWDLPV